MNTSRASVCQGKIRHQTRHCANAAMQSLSAANADLTLTVYHCRYCRGYHVGHPEKREQRKLAYNRLLDLIAKANGKETPR